MTPENFALGALISILMVVFCVLVHFEGLTLLDRLARAERKWIRQPRNRIVLVMVGVVFLHVLEIWMFGGLYMWLDANVTHSDLLAASRQLGYHRDWFDYIYFSAVSYTTVGYGDLIPTGIYRILSTSEALIGFLLVTWSASFTYLLMQRLWGRA